MINALIHTKLITYFPITHRYQVLAVATDARSKEETINIRSGKRVVVRMWMQTILLTREHFV